MNARSAIRNKTFRNKTWAELNVGDAASIERSCSAQDLVLFAHVSGNVNPLTLPSADSRAQEGPPMAPSMWIASLISAVLGNVLPGAGTLYRGQDLRFLHRVHVGDKLKVTVVCCEKREEPVAVFDTQVEDEGGHVVCEGTAEVDAPTVTRVTEARDLPTLIVDSVDHFAPLIARAAQLPPLKTAVVCPEDRNSLGGAMLSAEKGLIEPILIGEPARMQAAAKELSVDISTYAIIAVSDAHAAAAHAIAMVLEGKAHAVMKGAIHSDALLAEVVKEHGGLRTHARISHVFAMDVPTLDKLLFIPTRPSTSRRIS